MLQNSELSSKAQNLLDFLNFYRAILLIYQIESKHVIIYIKVTLIINIFQIAKRTSNSELPLSFSTNFIKSLLIQNFYSHFEINLVNYLFFLIKSENFLSIYHAQFLIVMSIYLHLIFKQQQIQTYHIQF